METKKIEGITQNNQGNSDAYIRGVKRCLFEGTILDGAIMVYVDNIPVPMVREDYKEKYPDKNYDGEYFRNITTGEIYHIHTPYFVEFVGPCTMSLPSDTKKEPLLAFLTKEEGQKAMTGNFTDLDAWALSQRAAAEAKTLQSRQ